MDQTDRLLRIATALRAQVTEQRIPLVAIVNLQCLTRQIMNSSIPRAQPDTLIQALEEARSRVNQISSGVIEQVVAVRRLEGRPELWIERALCAIGMPARNI
ncbi:hypothetical protein A3D62_01130 [Candidatus Kaiserbacteria bacterium RIFCSPHIGHO2_02_FULL_49_11]|uniref:Uncharacterized protein n=1 Tax=Candidatus Kaiserbacteria bacterium RIFCSPHIGHO2_02_FULL_49_11 TaxID=1798489 RepID=A0A1F6D101_9BACT|nr:MAG: hypothetical protein A3D62_01130 [Candidatus Kaiserbacteria bacterium RIFCSPHIGHO2_02_FULL_49_11]